ncbi:MAG: tetratricopeptide repeat protein, partial [Planctomycetota bacterium]
MPVEVPEQARCLTCGYLLRGLMAAFLSVTMAAAQPEQQTEAAGAAAPTTEPVATTTQAVPTLRDAHDLYVEGYYPRAIEQFETLATDPQTRLAATLGIVRCRLMTGDYEDAHILLASVEADGQRSADWSALAAESDATLGRYGEALEHAQQAVKLDKAHYRARYLLGELLETVGRRDEAVEAYRWFDALLSQRFPETAEAVTETAKGFHRYNVLTTHPLINDRTKHVLNELLQVAYTRMDRTCWPARLAAADLLNSKYNLEEAAADYKAALRINNNLPAAYVGLGRIALDGWDFEETERRTASALQINPRYVPALTLRAEQKITERRYAEASEACRQALEINPNDIRALSLAAAAALCLGDRETSAVMQARVEKINPHPALLHAILGDVLGGLRRYADSEAHYLRAVEYDPTDANSRCELGMMYMQWGIEDQARTALDAAWALDEFNARTKHTLELLDSLGAFATCETEHFIIRYDAQRDAVLPRYMASYLEEMYGEVCADYAARPEDRTIVEVFPTSQAFGVRITGKPWIFTVGACTGRVIALSSPRRDPQLLGPYNFARALRHEFTHTVTLGATQNRIPHWFTEGLAVLQEDGPRSFTWCASLADRVRRDELFTLESIDWGFMRPRREDDRQVAYAQSEWMCEYLVERF